VKQGCKAYECEWKHLFHDVTSLVRYQKTETAQVFTGATRWKLPAKQESMAISRAVASLLA
jgi:hypothetical protein